MDDEFEGQPMVNPPTPPVDPVYQAYLGTMGMSPGTTGTSAANPAVAQGGLANQQPGAGASVATQNQNYMQPYWLQGPQKNPLSINTGSGSLIGAAGSAMSGGGCD